MCEKNQAGAFLARFRVLCGRCLPAIVACLRERHERRQRARESERPVLVDGERLRGSGDCSTAAVWAMDEELRLCPATLTELTSHKQATLNITGTSRTSSLNLALVSTVDYSLEVEIPRGTCIQSINTLKQNMMSVETIRLRLSSRASADAVIPAVCINRRLAVPALGDEFVAVSDSSPLFGAAKLPKPAYLDRMLDSPRFKEGNPRVRQFAIWTITDDLTRQTLKDLIRDSLVKRGHEPIRSRGISSALSQTARAAAIDREAARQSDILLADIRKLFESIGLEIKKYELFRPGTLAEMLAAA